MESQVFHHAVDASELIQIRDRLVSCRPDDTGGRQRHPGDSKPVSRGYLNPTCTTPTNAAQTPTCSDLHPFPNWT